MSNLKVHLSIADAFIGRFAEVVEELRQAGLQVDGQLESLGVVTGEVAPDRLNGLRGLPGVASVETEGPVEIAPPDSEIQ